MNAELLNQFLETIEAEVRSRSLGMEFEMAYQMRVVIDRIKLAVKQTEEAEGRADRIHEAGLLSLDALDRLQSVEARFQRCSRHTAPCEKQERLAVRWDRITGGAKPNETC